MVQQWGKIIFIGLVLLIAVTVNAFRFYDLENTPIGAQVDELSSSVTLQCLATEGVDAHGRHYPLFSDLNYGTPLSPNHLYLGMFWVKAFGHSVASLRALSATYLVVTIVSLFFLARLMFGSGYGWWVVLAASLSPWVWSLSRVAFESLVALPFFVWGLYFVLSGQRFRNYALAAVFFALSMYGYPPMRLSVPLLIMLVWGYTWLAARTQGEGGVQKRFFFLLLLILAVLIAPMVKLILDGSLTRRFNEISIFADSSAWKAGWWPGVRHYAGMFGKNFVLHLSPDYLFIKGGGNGINLARGGGILAWHEVIGLLAVAAIFIKAVWHKIRGMRPVLGRGACWCLFLLAGFLLGIVPSALTTSDLPNSLRMMVSWPFAVLLASYGLWRMTEKWTLLSVPVLAVAVVFASFYLKDYFKNYNSYAGHWYQPWVKARALSAKTEMDWISFVASIHGQDYHVRYYLMRYHKDSCSSSREKYEQMRAFLRSIGKD